MDLSNLQAWHYGVIVGGTLLVVGLLLYAIGVRKVKVPLVLPAGFGGVAVGLAAGMIWLAGFGYKPLETEGATGPPAGGAPKDGGGAPKGAGASAATSPRLQLIALVNALDMVVDRSVAATLTPEDRAAIWAQLKGLDAPAELSNDEAKARLDALLKVVEKDRKALEAIGYRWPVVAPKSVADIPPPAGAILSSPNAFQAPQTAAKIRSLGERLEKK